MKRDVYPSAKSLGWLLCASCMVIASAAIAHDGNPPMRLGLRVPVARSHASGLNRPGHPTARSHLPNAYFEENLGQTKATVKFLSRQGRSRVAIDEHGIAWSTRPIGTPHAPQIRLTWATSQSSHATLEGVAQTGGRTNYVLGNDPKRWILGARQYRTVREAGVYPGIDVVYRALQDKMRYDVQIKSHANPASIRMVIAGASSVTLGADGALHMKREGLSIDNRPPVAYQDIAGQRHPVNVTFRLMADNTVGFAVGRYDHTQALVIDPTVVFSSYIGGSQDDNAWSVGVTKNENLDDFVQGMSGDTATMLLDSVSTNLPVVGPSASYAGGTDEVFVVKLDGDGQNLIYATYIGGSDEDDGYSLATDKFGSAYLTGTTFSKDFPVLNAFQPASHSGAGISDAFLMKLDPRGVPMYSTYFAGHLGAQSFAVAVDRGGNAAMTGYTYDVVGGTDPGDFPVINAAQPTVHGTVGTSEAFVARFNATGQPVFSTFLGGDGQDTGLAVAYDQNGNVYTTGYTASNNQFVTGNALQSVCGSTATPCSPGENPEIADAFLAIHSAAGALEYTSYLGGSQFDAGNAVAVYQSTPTADAEVTVGGATYSPDFPVASAFQGSLLGPVNGFVSTFTVTPGYGVSVAASTYLGGSTYDSVYSAATDRWGNIYAGGITGSADFPLLNPLQSTFVGTDMAFIAVFQSPVAATNGQPGSQLRFSTFFGGSGASYVDGIAPDDFPFTTYSYTEPPNALTAGGGMYIALGSTSADFPVRRPIMQGIYSGGVYHGGNEGVVARIGLCNHMNALPTMQPAAMVALLPVPGKRPVDQRVYKISVSPDPSTKVPIDPKALKSMDELASQRSPHAPNNPRTHRALSVEWNQYTGTLRTAYFFDPLKFDPLPGEDDLQRAKRFVLSHPEWFRLTAKALERFNVYIRGRGVGTKYIDASGYVTLEQHFGDIPIYNSSRITVQFKGAAVSYVGGHYYPADQPPQTKPMLDVSQAFAAMRKHLPNWWKTADGKPSPHDGTTGPLTFAPTEGRPPSAKSADQNSSYTRISHVGMDFTDTLNANLVYFQIGADLHLGWHFTSQWLGGYRGTKNKTISWVEAIVDADNGEVLFAKTHMVDENLSTDTIPSFVAPRHTGNIIATRSHGPIQSYPFAIKSAAAPRSVQTTAQGTVFIPNPGVGMATVSLAGDPTASPDGWLDRFGSTFYSLGGNNACADDRSFAQPTPAAGTLPGYVNDINWRAYSPLAADGQFTYPWADAYRTSNGMDKTTDIDIALTNAFYWVNLAHDRFYALGFDEAHWNFQRRNFERDPATGITLNKGNDNVQIFVHYSADNFSTSDASFQNAPDGFRPHMDLYLGNTAPYTDFAVDGGTLLHEYAHGVTGRMIGNETTVGLASQDLQPRALSEGWSDFFAASILDDPVIGVYLSGNAQTGIRKYALDANPMTLATFCCDSQALTPEEQVYESELLWASTLWDLRSLLRQSYGDQVGTQMAEKIVIGSLNQLAIDTEEPPITVPPTPPFNPNIIQARVDLLQTANVEGATPGRLADYVLACRGMGRSATTTGTNDMMPMADYTLSDGSLCAGLSIFVTDDPDPVAVQSELTYTVTITNGSPVPGAAGTASDNTQVMFTVPAGLSNAVATPNQGTCGTASGNTVTCMLGTLAYGAQSGIVLAATPQTPGIITLQATVEGDIGGPNPGQPSASEDTTVCVPDLVFGNGFETTTPMVICQ